MGDVVNVYRLLPDPVLDPRGQRAHGLALVLFVSLAEFARVDRISEPHQDPRQITVAVFEVEPDGYHPDPERPVAVGLCAEGDARRSRLDVPDVPLRRVPPLREDPDRPPVLEHLVGRAESVLVGALRRRSILAPVDGDDARVLEEERYQRVVEEPAPRQVADGAVRLRAENDRVHDRVRVVGGEDHRRFVRDAIGAGRTDVHEVELEAELQDASQSAVEERHRARVSPRRVARPGRRRAPRWRRVARRACIRNSLCGGRTARIDSGVRDASA